MRPPCNDLEALAHPVLLEASSAPVPSSRTPAFRTARGRPIPRRSPSLSSPRPSRMHAGDAVVLVGDRNDSETCSQQEPHVRRGRHRVLRHGPSRGRHRGGGARGGRRLQRGRSTAGLRCWSSSPCLTTSTRSASSAPSTTRRTWTGSITPEHRKPVAHPNLHFRPGSAQCVSRAAERSCRLRQGSSGCRALERRRHPRRASTSSAATPPSLSCTLGRPTQRRL